jgi:hypothetical protein
MKKRGVGFKKLPLKPQKLYELYKKLDEERKSSFFVNRVKKFFKGILGKFKKKNPPQ